VFSRHSPAEKMTTRIRGKFDVGARYVLFVD
jgi:hypothetical protein